MDTFRLGVLHYGCGVKLQGVHMGSNENKSRM